jgi:hypothetical protein
VRDSAGARRGTAAAAVAEEEELGSGTPVAAEVDEGRWRYSMVDD